MNALWPPSLGRNRSGASSIVSIGMHARVQCGREEVPSMAVKISRVRARVAFALIYLTVVGVLYVGSARITSGIGWNGQSQFFWCHSLNGRVVLSLGLTRQGESMYLTPRPEDLGWHGWAS